MQQQPIAERSDERPNNLTEEQREALAVLDEQGISYDPSKVTLDLTKDEKRRTTALLMAIQAYDKLIIKDAEYLKEAYAQQRQSNGPVIKPATMNAMVEAALQFDAFISGRLTLALPKVEPENGDE